MELRSILAENAQVEFVINEIRKQSKTLATDVMCAYNLFCDNNSDLNESAMRRLENVFVMCKYMEPEAEDVITITLLTRPQYIFLCSILAKKGMSVIIIR